jgi:hypothetical protein
LFDYSIQVLKVGEVVRSNRVYGSERGSVNRTWTEFSAFHFKFSPGGFISQKLASKGLVSG